MQANYHGKVYFVTDLADPRYRLARPVPVEVIISEGDVEDIVGKFVVSDNLIENLGWGDTLAEAWRDYQSSFVKYYEQLRDNERRLGRTLQEHLDWLRGMVEEREKQ